nr:MAG TPA: hypothetical protein [Bacteriophage sp.]
MRVFEFGSTSKNSPVSFWKRGLVLSSAASI